GATVIVFLLILIAALLFPRVIGPEARASNGCAGLSLLAGQIIAGAATNQYVWSDSACQQRSVALLLSDVKGGSANQFTYQLSDGSTRVVGLSPSAGAAGFGYIVSHLHDPSLATNHGEDDSPL